MEFSVQTPKHKLKINCRHQFFDISDVKINKTLYNELCRKGCKNYSKKYSCPPYSPDFKKITKNSGLLLALMFWLDIKQLAKTDYLPWHKVMLANRVMKPKIENIMRELEHVSGTNFLATGSCRLCNPCQLKLKKPCKHPDKRRYSLEASGVDCNDLSRQMKKPLQWLSKSNMPEYTSVICGLPVKTKDKSRIEQRLMNILRKL